MANMSYCRFQNTRSDLRDCYEALHETDLSEDEQRARADLVALCQQIVDEYDPADVGDPVRCERCGERTSEYDQAEVADGVVHQTCMKEGEALA